MKEDYSPEVCRRLEAEIAAAGPLRVYRPAQYDPGKVLYVAVTGVCPAHRARATMVVERFVGGGFAGQVYRVRIEQVDPFDGPIEGLETGRSYAVKILAPPSRFARLFRNAIYAVGYQGAFSAQVNYAAARVGVLWQKLIRRAARIRFGSDTVVADTYAIFYDASMGSFGEINEWVEGRVWRFEIDDRLFRRVGFSVRRASEVPAGSRSREYLSKRLFMRALVQLLHDMGAVELARQYEWWTMKSQPNVLKRNNAGDDSEAGLVAIDFRAGLALLPFLPMSPGDFKLIFNGLRRGDLVQFDRGDLSQLERFVDEHRSNFDDLMPALDELYRMEPVYRNSLLDVTHHVRLLTDRSLRRSVADGYVQGWLCRGVVDEGHAARLRESRGAFAVFLLAGALPLVGRLSRRLWGNAQFASHVRSMVTNLEYFKRSARARQAEIVTDWYRHGKVTDRRAGSLLNYPVSFWTQWLLLGWLPSKWFRFFTDAAYARDAIVNAVTYPIRFYRDASFREQWLTEIVEAGAGEGMLTKDEEMRILGAVKDPFIQKYLKCLAVHLCTLPITQVVSVPVAIYAAIRYGKTWAEAWAFAGGILIFFQMTPISPGSLVRGSYVVYLMIRERNWRDYLIAVIVSFGHYIGYLAFPIQMVAKFPELSRFMAGRWATSIVRLIPVFGERGALVEHWVFDLFFNVPVSIRRKLVKDRAP